MALYVCLAHRLNRSNHGCYCYSLEDVGQITVRAKRLTYFQGSSRRLRDRKDFLFRVRFNMAAIESVR